MSETREQAPPSIGQRNVTTADLESFPRDPDRHYRIIGKDKEATNSARLQKHKAKGYRTECEDDLSILVSCPKDVHEKRQAENVARAERSRKAAAKMQGGVSDRGTPFKDASDDPKLGLGLGQERMPSPQ